MKTTSLMFKPELVLKIISGVKDLTRRPLRNQPAGVDMVVGIENGEWSIIRENGVGREAKPLFNGKRPTYMIGDEILVRELWSTDAKFDRIKPSKILKRENGWVPIWYGADNSLYWHCDGEIHADSPDVREEFELDDPVRGKKRSSMFMPKWAFRIRLKIVELNIERVCDITEEDCVREGASPGPSEWMENNAYRSACSYLSGFLMMWDKINIHRGMGTEVNPLVWRIEFKAKMRC